MAKDPTWEFVLFGKKIFSFGRSSTKLMLETDIDATFADIAAADETKPKLQQVIDLLKLPEDFKGNGIGMPRGVLIVGPPGEDRTLLAKAFAGEAHVPLFSISGPDFVDTFPGVAASRIHDLFEQARKHVPCVIFIDDIDAIFARSDKHSPAEDQRMKTRDQLLSELDSDAEQKRIVVIASTNSHDQIDSSLLRRGRFDHCFRIERNQNGSVGVFAVELMD
jgi:cell division protease FtsH